MKTCQTNIAMKFIRKKSKYELLHQKWAKRHGKIKSSFFQKHNQILSSVKSGAQKLAVGGASALVLVTIPPTPKLPPVPTPVISPQVDGKEIDKRVFLITDLKNELPDQVRPLNRVEEDVVEQTLTRHFGVVVKAELEDTRLNRTYGFIGQEQHLARYPGDNMDVHFDSFEASQKFYKYGMAPGLGAYRYFGADTLGGEREKWYIAVQTFLSPGYYEHTGDYNNFFKFRKMLVVNPQNGKAVVAVIGDAGPAQWTGKSLGGSPEVMNYLERVDGAQKGPVLYFFVDDPQGVVPLGPVEIQ